MSLSAEVRKRITELAAGYRQPRGALMTSLWVVQEQNGFISEEDMRQVADLLRITKEEVYGVATYFSMYQLEPVGRYLIRVCTNLACRQRGAEDLFKTAVETLGIEEGETTPDGIFTLEATECIGACHLAPAVMINYELHGPLNGKGLKKLLRDLKRGAKK